VPRFYGVERYGIPKRVKSTHGLYNRAVRLLRDYQEDIVETYINHIALMQTPRRVRRRLVGGGDGVG
jgi:hypothetical protein